MGSGGVCAGGADWIFSSVFGGTLSDGRSGRSGCRDSGGKGGAVASGEKIAF